MACCIRLPVFVTGPMRGLEEKFLFGWVAGFYFVVVNYLMDKINILCDNQQIWMLYTHEKYGFSKLKVREVYDLLHCT